MQRAMTHYPPREMAVLGLIEFVLSFAVIYTVIQAAPAAVSPPAVFDMLPRGGVALAAVLTSMTAGVALTIGLYRLETCLSRKGLLTVTSVSAIITLSALLYLHAWPGHHLNDSRAPFAPMVLAGWLATTALIRLGYGLVVRRKALSRRVFLLGEPRQLGAFSARLRSRRGRMFDPVVRPNQAVSWQSLRAERIWGIVITSWPEGSDLEPLMDCKLRGMRIYSGAAFHEAYLGRIDLDALETNDLVLGQGYIAGPLTAMLKRFCDILIGSLMLILTLPLMAVTALAVKIESSGPVLYRQQRVGRFGEVFTLLKFRSMAQDAEAGGNPRWAQKQDPRVTRVGRFIRAARIDELPQLVNVLRGEMSLVGPRPERPHFVEQLAHAIPMYHQRAYVKPGLTGWAQVNFPYGASVEDAREKLAYDLYYVKNRSIMLDVIILMSTIRVVLFREGAR